MKGGGRFMVFASILKNLKKKVRNNQNQSANLKDRAKIKQNWEKIFQKNDKIAVGENNEKTSESIDCSGKKKLDEEAPA